jgi:DtxR family Mn-dependent transcriptional regulator
MTDARPSRACCGLDPTPAVEDALRAVFVLTGRGEPVTTSLLAQVLGVQPSTVSSMLKRLTEHDLLDRTDPQRAVLTAHGARHARHVVRRHRLVETLLVEVLGMPVEEVHAEADALEHAVSDALLERIDDRLGRPAHDPHGDPVPRGEDDHAAEARTWGVGLDDVAAPSRFAVERVHDWDGAALRHLHDLGIQPGVMLDVLERGPFGGPLWVRLDGHELALGDGLTRLVHGQRMP